MNLTDLKKIADNYDAKEIVNMPFFEVINLIKNYEKAVEALKVISSKNSNGSLVFARTMMAKVADQTLKELG